MASKSKKTAKSSRDVLAVILVIAILVSGLFIVHQSNLRLETYTQLTELRLQQDRELSEYSRLLIEKESLSSYAFVLRDAKSNGMVHPDELNMPEASLEP